ncbi:MAG: transcriptional regulator, GntR family with aminotransferase domain [Gammaproteobacteria bacterium]|nr:transcriptional regulator, GntR family with aminotransferase domain [Gammaproteobacteria bacterium]
MFWQVHGLGTGWLARWMSSSIGATWHDLNCQFKLVFLDQFAGVNMSDRSHRGRGRALYEEIKARVLDGTYGAGAALPSTRACAAERGLSRTTVSTVYEELASEGFIKTKPGGSSRVAAGAKSDSDFLACITRPADSHCRSGARARLSAFGERVSELKLPSTATPLTGNIDFMYGPLAGADFPTLTWMKASRQVDRERPERLAYTDARGDLRLRRALQSYVARSRGISCSVGQLVIVNGSQQALDFCARLLLDPGDKVVVENPGYRMAHHVFSAAGARLHGISVDHQGLKTDQLRRVRRATFAYVTPTHQFPLGSFLTMPRRQSLLKWAAQTGAWILEDDYDSEYRYAVRPVPTLQSLDENGAVIYIGTFSKILSPELRLGYMIVPERLVDAMASAKQLADRHSASKAQRTLAILLEEGSYDRHVRRLRRLQEARRTALLAALERYLPGRLTVDGASSGLHLVIWIHELSSAREADLVAAARREQVLVHPVGPLYLTHGGRQAPRRSAGLVLGYALLDPDQIERGVKRLAAAVRRMG